MASESRGGALAAGASKSLYAHTIDIRVRYPECDSMGYLHHSRYLQYFEMGRIEVLRSFGHSYADMEQRGIYFVVVRAELRFRAPARYDDELQLTTHVMKRTAVRFDHYYELRKGDVMVAEGATTIACVDKTGALVQIPAELMVVKASDSR